MKNIDNLQSTIDYSNDQLKIMVTHYNWEDPFKQQTIRLAMSGRLKVSSSVKYILGSKNNECLV